MERAARTDRNQDSAEPLASEVARRLVEGTPSRGLALGPAQAHGGLHSKAGQLVSMAWATVEGSLEAVHPIADLGECPS